MTGILFDFNGTMFWDGPKHKEAWDVFSMQYRAKPVSDVEMAHMHGQTNRQIIKLLMGDMEEVKSAQLSESKEALYRACCLKDTQHLCLAPGLEQLLHILKQQNVPMTICSASIKANIDFFIETFHLDKWFDIHNIVYDDGSHQDKVTMFLEGAQRIQEPIGQCLVIEDSLSGIAFAKQAGAKKVIALTDQEKHIEYENLYGVDEVIQDFYDFNMSWLD